MEAGTRPQRPYPRGVTDDPVPAGELSSWFAAMQVALRGEGESDVPCGALHRLLPVGPVRAHRTRRDRHARARPRGAARARPGASEGARGAGVRRARALPDARGARLHDLRAPAAHVPHLRLPGVRRHRDRARSDPARGGRARAALAVRRRHARGASTPARARTRPRPTSPTCRRPAGRWRRSRPSVGQVVGEPSSAITCVTRSPWRVSSRPLSRSNRATAGSGSASAHFW